MSDLIEDLGKKGPEFDFFQALVLLEEYYGGAGEGNEKWLDRIRLSPDPDIVFPTGDIAYIQEDTDRINIFLSFMGLMGVSSPLPHYFTEYGAEHRVESCALTDFLNIFDGKFYYLFYLAWKKYRPFLSCAKNRNFMFSRSMLLAGLDSDVAESTDTVFSSFSGMLAGTPRNADGLIEIIGDYLGNVEVSIEQWNERWVRVDDVMELGVNLVLADNFVLGERIFDRSGKFTVILRLNDKHELRSYISGSSAITSITRLIDNYLPRYLEYDIRVKFTSANLVPVAIGADNAGLGIDSTYGSRSGADVSEYSMTVRV